MKENASDPALLKYIQTRRFKEALAIPEDAVVEPLFLAQGENHKNYRFTHPVSGQELVLRVNYKSEMRLKNQIGYEYEALKMLEPTGHVPKVCYVDDRKDLFPRGILVMEFLQGRPLDYARDLKQAARALADIHSMPVPKEMKLIEIPTPIRGILQECEEMFGVYRRSPFANEHTIKRIEDLRWIAHERAEQLQPTAYDKVCINTELNNHNFIVDEQTGFVYVIDWEKPLLGDPAQDLGHMLTPTTSFWKTDVILSEQQVEQFAEDYVEAVGERIDLGNFRERLQTFLQVTCLRGVTWCAMAWDEYHKPEREIKNAYTYEKLKAYLDDTFLDQIEMFMQG